MLALGAVADDALCESPRGFLERLVVSTRFFSSHEFTTDPGDLPADVIVDGGLQPFRLQKAMALDGAGQFSGFAAATFGELVLSNAGGRFAERFAERFAVDGRRITFREGVERVDPSGRRVMPRVRDCTIKAVARAETWSISEREVRIRLHDASAQLRIPLQQSTYGGRGATDGGPELAGVSKPLVFGLCRNVSPVKLDPLLLLFQVHDGPLRALDGVFDGGVRLAPAFDMRSLAALLAAETEPGDVLAFRPMGLFRLGSEPAGIVTCDVRGDGEDPDEIGDSAWDDGASWDDGTTWTGPAEGLRGYTSRIGSIIRRVVQWVGWRSVDLDRGWTNGLNDAFPEPIGVALPVGGQVTALQLLSELTSSVCGWCEVDRTGALTGGLLERPAGTSPVVLDDSVVVEAARLDLPYGRPPWRYSVPFARNWTPLSADQVFAQVREQDPAGAAWLTQASRFADVGDAAIRLAFPAAEFGVRLPAFFATEQAALRAGRRRLGFYHRSAVLLQLTVRGLRANVRLGKQFGFVRPALGFPAVRQFVVVGYNDGPGGESILSLFG